MLKRIINVSFPEDFLICTIYNKSMEEQEYLNFARQMALDAGEIMLKYFNTKNISSYKKDDSIVTIADKEINSHLITCVKQKYPQHSVLGEEEDFGKSNYVWVCDPIDGTMPYAAGVPVSTFALALVVDGVAILGVVYDPFLKRLYCGVKNGGAFCNGEKLKVNEIGLDDKGSIGHSVVLPKNLGIQRFDLARFNLALHERTMVVSFYSTARTSMAIAEGHFNFSILPFIGKFSHDIAALKVIVEEAGGIVRNFYGQEDQMDGDIKGAIICNRKAYNDICGMIKQHVKF